MKQLITFVFLISIGITSFSATQKVNVNGMVCAFCAQGIEKSVKTIPQVQDVYVNLEEHFIIIATNDDQGIPDKTIKSIIIDAGYDVAGIEMISDSISAVRNQYEKK